IAHSPLLSCGAWGPHFGPAGSGRYVRSTLILLRNNASGVRQIDPVSFRRPVSCGSPLCRATYGAYAITLSFIHGCRLPITRRGLPEEKLAIWAPTAGWLY